MLFIVNFVLHTTGYTKEDAIVIYDRNEVLICRKRKHVVQIGVNLDAYWKMS
ncbi:hypothetical protein [Paenibacillus gyeongsangnamensis]|uniref:hypothetical protein n=1 Tax=Paenibacillus gyeongsangnamensis TaxID=3388067 RepID=UPI002FD15BF8